MVRKLLTQRTKEEGSEGRGSGWGQDTYIVVVGPVGTMRIRYQYGALKER